MGNLADDGYQWWVRSDERSTHGAIAVVSNRNRGALSAYLVHLHDISCIFMTCRASETFNRRTGSSVNDPTTLSSFPILYRKVL